MNLVTEPVNKQSLHDETPHNTKEWLDALSNGTCDREDFFRGVADIMPRGSDAGWDLLALIDQYYRRGKISVETFGALKSHFQRLLMGKGSRNEVSTPVPTMQGEPAARPAAAIPASRIPALPRAPSRVAPVPVATPHPAAESTVAADFPARPQTATRQPSALPDAPHEAPELPGGAHAVTITAGDLLRGRYRIQGLLGQGGMGTVFAAVDQYRLDRSQVDQRVALKVLHTEVIRRPRLFAELRREFQHLQSLSHPNIVRVHEFDRDGDLAFFTMEYLSGALLSRIVAAHESSALYRPYALAMIRDVGAAVAHAHARGVVHGDLNPGNIFVTDGGEIRVLDFGASHQLHHGPWISEFDNQQPVAVATVRYASCQVLEGEIADSRDDIFALACVAYLLLAGDHPFQDNSALKARTLGTTPRRPRGLRRRQWAALRAGLHYAREQRPADMQAWLEQLDLGGAAAHLPALPLLTPRLRRRASMKWPVVGMVTAALLIACGWLVSAYFDDLGPTSAAVSAKLKAAFAHTVISQWWEKGHGYRGHVEPVIDGPVPANSAPGDAAPEAVLHPIAPSRLAAAAGNNAMTAAAQSVHDAPSAMPRPPLQTGLAAAAAAVPIAPAAQSGGVDSQNGTGQRARVELAADNIDLLPTDSMAHVVVKRSRSFRGDVSFNWWTESGTAKPGRDFQPVKTQAAQIDNAKNSVTLTIPIVPDPARHEPRSFYVVIDEASDNAALGPRTLSMVTIPGPGGAADPASD